MRPLDQFFNGLLTVREGVFLANLNETLCGADLDDGNGFGVADGGVDISDFIYFMAAFEAGTLDADIADGNGLGTPDGGVDINDLIYFLTHFEAGC